LNCDVDCPHSNCGNNACESGENTVNCPDDCRYDQGIAAMTEYQVINYIPEQVASKGAVSAARECDLIPTISIKDTCFFWVMKSSNSSSYCQFIETPNKKDDCYVSYAYNTDDYAVCTSITDRYKRETCELLGKNYEVESSYT